MRSLLVLTSLLLACGDNVVPVGPDLAQAAELVIVAHPGDELLLMQPDIRHAVERGGITTVYLHDESGARDGLRAAYGHVAASTDWHCGSLAIEGDVAHHCRLADANISLVFLDAPALATLTRIARLTNPDVVRTLEIANTHGEDDADHTEAGRQTLLALATTNRSAQVLAYRGDAIVDEPPNKLTPVFDQSFEMLARFAACTSSCGAECGGACTAIDERDVDLLLRRYAVGFRRNAGGRLRIANECLGLDLALASCDTAPVWTLDGAGELRNGEMCIAVGAAGALALQPCLGGVDLRWFVDDDGHIMTTASELRCLTPRDGAAALEPCGPTNDPRWELVPAALATPRASLGISATGRDVRLADVTGDRWADLCAVEAGELHCARGNGLGSFLAATRIDSPDAPLVIDARSLTFGDVDADGRLDACGRNEQGVLCATAMSGFRALAWSPAFDAARAVASTAASLTAIDADADSSADLCGVDQQGVLCAFHAGVFNATVRSAWPDDDAVVWFGDLDGDAAADWCAATDDGPACALWDDRALTMDGTPWGYAHDGVVDVAPATTATVALADIDRDGRADLCSLRDDRIVCARSQGRAFGPRVTLSILPNQTTASALWLGDLDGDGRADPCVDTGTDIVCARQPQ